jgi:hypothetical protein
MLFMHYQPAVDDARPLEWRGVVHGLDSPGR